MIFVGVCYPSETVPIRVIHFSANIIKIVISTNILPYYCRFFKCDDVITFQFMYLYIHPTEDRAALSVVITFQFMYLCIAILPIHCFANIYSFISGNIFSYPLSIRHSSSQFSRPMTYTNPPSRIFANI